MSHTTVDLYEKIWMWASVVMIGFFMSAIGYGAYSGAQHPASHVETIDPRTARQDARFAEPGVYLRADGGADVIMLAQMFSFTPNMIRVPAGKPITFRLTSPDLIHGFQRQSLGMQIDHSA